MGEGIAVGNADAFGVRRGKRALNPLDKMRAQQIVIQRERQRATRAEDPLFGDA